jgi:hypothetical protein
MGGRDLPRPRLRLPIQRGGRSKSALGDKKIVSNKSFAVFLSNNEV